MPYSYYQKKYRICGSLDIRTHGMGVWWWAAECEVVMPKIKTVSSGHCRTLMW
jgi:hypothetical protein